MSIWDKAATRSRIGKAAKVAHDWTRECRKAGRSWSDAALVGEPCPPSFHTQDEYRVFRAVCEVLTERHADRKVNSSRAKSLAMKRRVAS